MVIVPRNSGGREGTPPYSRVVIFSISVVILNDTISQPGQIPYFFLNFGPLPASVSYKTLFIKKNDCIALK